MAGGGCGGGREGGRCPNPGGGGWRAGRGWALRQSLCFPPQEAVLQGHVLRGARAGGQPGAADGLPGAYRGRHRGLRGALPACHAPGLQAAASACGGALPPGRAQGGPGAPRGQMGRLRPGRAVACPGSRGRQDRGRRNGAATLKCSVAHPWSRGEEFPTSCLRMGKLRPRGQRAWASRLPAGCLLSLAQSRLRSGLQTGMWLAVRPTLLGSARAASRGAKWDTGREAGGKGGWLPGRSDP